MGNEPRLCEIIGVKVNERVRVSCWDFDFFVDEKGNWKGENPDREVPDIVALRALLWAIKKPESVKHKRKWTRVDIDSAIAVCQLFNNAAIVERPSVDSTIVLIENNLEYGFLSLPAEKFPSIKSGESVLLKEILKGQSHE